jgi:hypothetical protein
MPTLPPNILCCLSVPVCDGQIRAFGNQDIDDSQLDVVTAHTVAMAGEQTVES